MKAGYLFILVLLTSCASRKEVVQGYSGPALDKALEQIQGKTPTEALKILGKPAAKGLCKKCGPQTLYRIIYPHKDMSRFHLDITANTDNTTDCVVLDFLPDYKLKKYVFDRRTGLKNALDCNQNAGAIGELKSILDIQEEENKRLKELQKK